MSVADVLPPILQPGDQQLLEKWVQRERLVVDTQGEPSSHGIVQDGVTSVAENEVSDLDVADGSRRQEQKAFLHLRRGRRQELRCQVVVQRPRQKLVLRQVRCGGHRGQAEHGRPASRHLQEPGFVGR